MNLCVRPLLLVLIVLAGTCLAMGASPSTTKPATSTVPTTSAANYGQDIVQMDELVDMYEAVPFEHRRHAQMAEMWDGCQTCHHHSPTTAPTAHAVTVALSHSPTQADAAVIPACKSCHPLAVDASTAITMPALKGAYHRQCLNCHRDWMDSNACVACHAARGATQPTTAKITPDDIVGRMHKPIPAPTTKAYVTRFTPVAGENVLFRHEEHAKGFGIRCVTCHRHDACASCHSVPGAATVPTTLSVPASGPTTEPVGSRPLKPGRTWRDTHGPCLSCHQDDHCTKCHYGDGQQPPPAFNHAMTGQKLDEDHADLACAKCHRNYRDARKMTCGDASCHDEPVSLPKDRPGPRVRLAKAATTNATATTRPATQPTTRPVIIRIRRGGA